MSASAPLVVVGSVNADTVLQVTRLPKPGETLEAEGLETYAGGKGANQAAAAASLLYPTYFLGQVGEDANADMLLRELSDRGVNVTHVRQLVGPTGSAFILLQPSGENSIIIVGGANTAPWTFTDADRQLLRTAGAVLLQREVPESVNVQAAQIARSGGVQVVLDCGGMQGTISDDLMSQVTILSPNETELARLTGEPETEERLDQEKVARALLQRWGNLDAVLLKLGSRGSMLVQRPVEGRSGECVLSQGAFPVQKVVDTTGAGDCFTAAFAVASLEGKPREDALRYAAAAAALCVQKPGAMPSMPTKDEVLRLLRDS